MEENKISIKEFKTLFPYLARYRTRYILGFICLVSVDGASIAIPQFTRHEVADFVFLVVIVGQGEQMFKQFLAQFCFDTAGRAVDKIAPEETTKADYGHNADHAKAQGGDVAHCETAA